MVRASARREHRVVRVQGEVIQLPVDDRELFKVNAPGTLWRPDQVALPVVEYHPLHIVDAAARVKPRQQLRHRVLAFAHKHKVGAVGQQILGKKIGVDAARNNPDVRMLRPELADLCPCHRVVGRDDREAHNVRAELLHPIPEHRLANPFYVLVEHRDIMPALLKDGADEANAQRVLTVHLLRVVRSRDDKQHSHRLPPDASSIL